MHSSSGLVPPRSPGVSTLVVSVLTFDRLSRPWDCTSPLRTRGRSRVGRVVFGETRSHSVPTVVSETPLPYPDYRTQESTFRLVLSLQTPPSPLRRKCLQTPPTSLVQNFPIDLVLVSLDSPFTPTPPFPGSGVPSRLRNT